MVHAEKVVTAMQRGTANTRWRDFADVYILSRRHDIDGRELSTAVGNVMRYRQTTAVPLVDVLEGYAQIGQARWAAWRRKQRLDDRLPERFEDVVDAVTAFADPALLRPDFDNLWDSAERVWKPRNASHPRSFGDS